MIATVWSPVFRRYDSAVRKAGASHLEEKKSGALDENAPLKAVYEV